MELLNELDRSTLADLEPLASDALCLVGSLLCATTCAMLSEKYGVAYFQLATGHYFPNSSAPDPIFLPKPLPLPILNSASYKLSMRMLYLSKRSYVNQLRQSMGL